MRARKYSVLEANRAEKHASYLNTAAGSCSNKRQIGRIKRWQDCRRADNESDIHEWNSVSVLVECLSDPFEKGCRLSDVSQPIPTPSCHMIRILFRSTELTVLVLCIGLWSFELVEEQIHLSLHI